MVSVAIKHPSDDVALQFIRNSIAINCKLHNNQQKTADLIYHNHTLRALNRQGVSQAGNFGGCGVEPRIDEIYHCGAAAPLHADPDPQSYMKPGLSPLCA
ncbi:hypothetical protein [Erwinia aphidicola]|uniref:hypothetical protein n=1 Tax=Erwinia aphidicola TaxID=68334 RepID=UPI0030196125